MDARTLEQIVRCSARERALLRLAARSRGSADQGVEVEEGIVQTDPDKVAAMRAVASVMQGLGLDYALIGGVAVGLRSGVPRATLDVDFAVPTQASWERLHAHLEAAGFEARGVFAHSRNYRHRTGEPVQFAFDEQFDAFIQRAEVLGLGDFALRVVTKDDLIAMKRRAAADPRRRTSKALRDRADIALLEEGAVSPDEDGW